MRLIANRLLLPALETVNTVTVLTGTLHTSIPTDWKYNKNLYAVQALDKPAIQVLASYGLLVNACETINSSDNSGDIKFITVKGAYLEYSPAPAEDTVLTCSYFMSPSTLNGASNITELPESYAEPALQSYLLWKCFETLEDGLEGYKVDTEYYKKEFYEALEALGDELQQGQSTPVPNRVSSWV
jgi:hypothetical protein